jgi:hypothetical protein
MTATQTQDTDMTARHGRHAIAYTALDRAGFDCINSLRGSKVVSTEANRQVWLIADILLDDERVLLRWVTSRGVEVADPVRVNIDGNCAAFVLALADVEVLA